MVSVDIVAGVYGETHQMLNRLLLQINCIKASKLIAVYCEICEACGHNIEDREPASDTFIDDLLTVMNSKLKRLNLSVELVQDFRFPDVEYVTLCSTRQDMKIPIKHLRNEQHVMFNNFLTIMFNGDTRGELEHDVAIYCGQPKRIFTPKQASNFLDYLMEHQYFVLDKERRVYTLHPRALREFEFRLRKQNTEIPSCKICNQLVTIVRFSTECELCKTPYHNTCLNKILKRAATLNCYGQDKKRCKHQFTDDILENLQFQKLPTRNESP